MSEDEIILTQTSALQGYLKDYLENIRANGMTKQRQSACEKLSKLSKQQFRELSTDVYDEMKRRVDQTSKTGAEIMPFLPVQSTFHPKRNQARQKLATLPEPRFKDLACDVYYELTRRYPETKIQLEKANILSGTSSSSRVESKPLEMHSPAKTMTHSALDPKKAVSLATLPPPLSPSATIERSKTVSMAIPLPATNNPEPEPETTLNFDSLDNLMADLGSMITTGNKKDSASIPAPAPPPPIIELPPPIAGSNLTVESAQQWRVSRDELTLLKQKHNEEIQALEENYQEKVAKLEGDHKGRINDYERRIQELETNIQELNSRPAVDPQAHEELKYQVEQNSKYLEKITQLELSARQEEEKVRTLTSQLAEEKEKSEKLRAKEAALLAENEDLSRRGAELAEQLATITQSKDSQIADNVKQLRKLIDEKNTIEMDRNEIQVENISLKEEIRNLKEKIASLQAQLASGTKEEVKQEQATSQSKQPEESSDVSVTEEMVFDGFEVKDLSNGIQELLKAVNGNNATEILQSMKAIVMTVRKHLDDAEEFEKTHPTVNQEVKMKINNLQNEISERLTKLVMVAKAHANGTYNATDGSRTLEQQAASLATIVVNLMKTISMSNHQVGDSTESEYEVQDLKNFLDQQTNLIVQAIQTMLLVLKGPMQPKDFLAAADSIVSAVTYLKNVAAHELRKNPNMSGADKAEMASRELVKSISHLLDIRQTIASNRPRPANQAIAAVAFEIAKHTKELVTVFGP